MAIITEKQLGQQRPPTGGTAVSLYSPPASTIGVIKSIQICNTSGAAATFRIFVDDDGTTYDETTAQFYDIQVAGGEAITLNVYWPMNNVAGNIAVESDTNNAFTFTAYGLEIS